MLTVHCDGHGGPSLLSTRSIVSIDQHDGRIEVVLRCWCGQLVHHVTGRNAAGDPVGASLAARAATKVVATAPARPAVATAHFAGRLAFETDPSDVWHDLGVGEARFVLLDVRSHDAFAERHLPDAVSWPHQELTAAAARTMLAERGADLFVTYCWRTSCNAATKAAAKLSAFGLPVKEMIGGIEGWMAEGLPVVEPATELDEDAFLADAAAEPCCA